MGRVKITAYVVYGSYSGNVTIIVEEDADLETLKAKIRKQERLDFLAMASYSVKVLARDPIVNDE